MAFMVPLVKNHYDIYHSSSRQVEINGENGFYMSTDSNTTDKQQCRQRVVSTPKKSQMVDKTVILNGMVLVGTKTSKPKIILGRQQKTPSASQPVIGSRVESPLKPIQMKTTSKPISKPNSNDVNLNQDGSFSRLSPSRTFPHVRRTVRNPMTNRVYSYSVSIPEYVAEEDEEELAQELMKDEEPQESNHSGESDEDDQVMIFSTSAPAGTGSINNGIVDFVDEDEFIHYTGTRLPPAISRTQSKILSVNKNNEEDDLLAQNNEQFSSQKTSNNSQSFDSQSNTREYAELLQKFVLHLKMLKLKKFFHTERKESTSKKQRQRSNTLNDSKHL